MTVVVVVGAGSRVGTVTGPEEVVDEVDDDDDDDGPGAVELTDGGPKWARGSSTAGGPPGGSAAAPGAGAPDACTSTADLPRPDGRVTTTTPPRPASATTPATASRRRPKGRRNLTPPLSEPGPTPSGRQPAFAPFSPWPAGGII